MNNVVTTNLLRLDSQLPSEHRVFPLPVYMQVPRLIRARFTNAFMKLVLILGHFSRPAQMSTTNAHIS